mgnify:CR=1 FL=1
MLKLKPMSEDLNKRLVDLKNDLVDSALKELKKSKTSSVCKRCGSICVWLSVMFMSVMYIALIRYVLDRVFITLAKGNTMDNNVAVVLAVVLLSATVALILSGVFLLRMREYGIDEKRLTYTFVEKEEQKKDKTIEELKDKFLKQVIDDTLQS